MAFFHRVYTDVRVRARVFRARLPCSFEVNVNHVCLKRLMQNSVNLGELLTWYKQSTRDLGFVLSFLEFYQTKLMIMMYFFYFTKSPEKANTTQARKLKSIFLAITLI